MILIEAFEEYSNSPQGFWLSLFDWRAVRIKPLQFQLQGLVTAFYCVLTDTIYAAPDKDHRVYFGTLCHELYHAHQRHTLGFFFYMLMKIFCRKNLQAPAKEVQLQAVQWACEQHLELDM